VLAKTGAGITGKVTLVSVGMTCRTYLYNYGQGASIQVPAMNQFCLDMYGSAPHADSARALQGTTDTSGELKTVKDMGLLVNGDIVMLGSGLNGKTAFWNYTNNPTVSGYVWSGGNNGFKIVVVLKSGTATEATAQETYFGRASWRLK